MPIAAAYQNDSLDGMVDAWPATGGRWALFNGVPVAAGGDGVELSGSGYTSPAFVPADFAAAASQIKPVAAAIEFGESTAAYAEVGTHWAILDSLDALVYWDDLPEAQVVSVLAAGTDVSISPSLFLATASD